MLGSTEFQMCVLEQKKASSRAYAQPAANCKVCAHQFWHNSGQVAVLHQKTRSSNALHALLAGALSERCIPTIIFQSLGVLRLEPTASAQCMGKIEF